MAPCQHMPNHQGDNSFVGFMRSHPLHPFSYQLTSSSFDSVSLEVHCEICYFDDLESGAHPYASDYELSSVGVKWFPNLGLFLKRRLNFLSYLALNHQTSTLLRLLFREKQIDNYKFSPPWRTLSIWFEICVSVSTM